MPNQFSTGLIASPYDKRDILTAEIIPEIKRIPKECPCPFDLSILNQNGFPHCVGYSGAGIKQYLEAKEKIWKIYDGSWLYRECKKIDGMPDLDGTYFRILLKVLQKIGAKPLNELESEAGKYKIGAYAQVLPLTFDELKKMIFLYGVVLLGFYGDDIGWQNDYIKPPQTTKWGHAVFGISYDESYIYFQNSWGENWGIKGIGHFDKNYLPFEAWIPLIDFPTKYQGIDLIADGYVAKEYLKAIKYYPGQEVKVNTIWGLRLRREPMGTILEILPNGKEIMILEDEDLENGGYKWVKIHK